MVLVREPLAHSAFPSPLHSICPGLQLADVSIWMSIAMVLAVFKIEKPIVNGKPVEPSTEFTSGTVSHPPPFDATIKPRSAKAEALLHSLAAEARHD